MRNGLIERDHELALIADACERAIAGQGGTLLLVEGQIGLGKSALIGAARQTAEELGLLVLCARGGQVERALEWAVVRDLFLPAITRASPTSRTHLYGGAGGLARTVLGVGASTSQPASQALPSALHGLYWLLAGMSEAGALAVVVDDGHWSDEPSLRWLTYLAARLDELPVVLVVAIRQGDPGARAAHDALLGAAPQGAHLCLKPLSAGASSQLMRALWGGDCSPQVAQACFEATRGNPLLLSQLTRALAAEDAEPAGGRALSPSSFDLADVARSVLVRIGRLTPLAAEVAAGAAVLGSHARLSEIAEVMEIGQGPAAAGADALVAAGVFAEGSEIEFVHPIVRDAVYEDIPPHRRSELHLRASQRLTRTRSIEASATHLLAVNPLGDSEIAKVLVAAADAALTRAAAGSAVLYLRRAIEENSRLADLHHRLGIAALRAGYLEEGFSALHRSLELADEPVTKSRIAIELAGRLTTLGTGQAKPFLEETLARLANEEIARPVQDAYLSLAVLWSKDFHGAVEGLRARYGRLAERTDDPLLIATLGAAALLANDEPAEAVSRLARTAAAGGLIEHQPLNQVTYAGVALVIAEAFEDAEEYWDRTVRRARRRQEPLAYAMAVLYRSLLYLRRGDPSSAEADARSAMDLGREHGYFQSDAVAHLADALVELDRVDEALDLLEEASPVPLVLAETWQGVYYRAARARVWQASGDQERALADFEACRRTPFSANPALLRAGVGIALAQHALGDSERARQAAEDELDAARRFGAPGMIGIAMRALGTITAGDAGIEQLKQAEAVLAASGTPLEHAKAKLELGAALRRSGRRGEARELLAQARQTARDVGGARVAALALEELRIAGARPRRDELRGRDALTASERRVAELAARGQTNAQIAQELFIGLRTVETHLTHAYQKLGIAGRPALGDALKTLPTHGSAKAATSRKQARILGLG